ncbi:MAG: hypothetical protein PHN80_07300 [Hespellia sp.]|nr:hypothetical protein [Hespellia sp.]
MKRRILYTLMSVIVAATAIAGCSTSSGATEETTSIYGQVTAIEGKKITIALAEEPEMGEVPDGDAADKEAPSGEAPEDAGQGGPGGRELTLTGEEQTITAADDTEFLKAVVGGGAPDGEAPEGETPEGEATDSGSEISESDAATSDNTADTTNPESQNEEKPSGEAPKDMGQQAEEASLDDLEVGDTVTVTMNGDTVVSITIQSGAGGGEAPDASGSATGSIDLSGVYTADESNENSDGETFESTAENENVVLAKNGGNLTMTKGTLIKSGDTTSNDESNFYGVNAVFAAAGGSEASISDTSLTSASEGSNAIFSTGAGSSIHVDNVTINTTGNSSRGLDATYGGSIDARNVTITTVGAHCAPIATDRGEGTITVDTANVSASGDGSPCIYSTGNITAKNVTGTATGSQSIVVEGKNSVSLENSDLSGAGLNGVMLYQSTSGDAGEGTAILDVKNSKLSTISTGPMFYVTNTDAETTLENTTLKFDSGILVQASGNSTNNWGTEGRNGGNFVLTGVNQTMEGNITCDNISTVEINLTQGSTLKSTVNGEHTGKAVSVILDKDSKWNVTGDSYLTVFTNADTSCANIVANGHTIYYDATNSANDWLGGKTIESSDGGKITPAA